MLKNKQEGTGLNQTERRAKHPDSHKQSKKFYIALGVMFILQLAVIIYCFQFKKEGCHSDEMWSYGYANSYYLKDIYQDNQGNPMHVNEWTDGKALWDYLVVNDGEQFAYGSVYQNQIKDLSPPLHSMILHTICSFFPESFSLWYSFVINIVSFLICMLFLYKSSVLLMDQRAAFLVCFLYGFSRGAIDNYIYLRMYALCTAFMMVILYYMIKSVKDEKGKGYMRNAIVLFLVSVAAFLTHYYMIAICGIMTVLFCVYLLFSKRIKRMFQLGFTMLAAFLSSVVLFPSLLMNSQSQTGKITAQNVDNMNYTFGMRFRILSSFITTKEFGFHVSVFPSNLWLEILMCCLFAMIMMIPVVFLFRKTERVQSVLKKIEHAVRNYKTVLIPAIIRLFHKINWIYIILLIACALQLIVVGETSSVYGMGSFEDRYTFNLCPIVVMVVIGCITALLNWIMKGNRTGYYIVTVLCIGIVGLHLYVAYYQSSYYLESNLEGTPIEECVKDKYVVYIEKNPWLLTSISWKLYGCDEFLLTNKDLYAGFQDDFIEKMREKELILIINTTDFESISKAVNGVYSADVLDEEEVVADEAYDNLIRFFEELDPTSDMQLLSKETVFTRNMETYCVNPK